MKTINQLASATRTQRDPLPLPGLVLIGDTRARVMAEVLAWDDALNILAVLAVEEA